MIEIGKEMRWAKSGGRTSYRVKVLKIGKRITVAVPIKGGVRKTVVAPSRLHALIPYSIG